MNNTEHYEKMRRSCKETKNLFVRAHLLYDQMYRHEPDFQKSRELQENARQTLNGARSAASRQRKYQNLCHE